MNSVQNFSASIHDDSDRQLYDVFLTVVSAPPGVVLWSVHRRFRDLVTALALSDDALWAWGTAGLIGLVSMYESQYSPLTTGEPV